MAKDFKASQIRSSQLVVSGGNGTSADYMIYSSSDASNFEGGYRANMTAGVGSDVFLFVSGNKNVTWPNPTRRDAVTLFGGDVVISGTFYAENSFYFLKSMFVCLF